MDLIERRDHARKNLDAIMVADRHRVEIRAATGFSSSRPTPSIDGSWPCSIRAVMTRSTLFGPGDCGATI
jgi:hypothetical protein